MAKKLHITDIDEDFIINSFRKDEAPNVPISSTTQKTPTEKTQKPVVKEETTRRKTKSKDSDYRQQFLKEASITARIGKTVYVRKEYHERIQRIVRVIGKDEVSLFSYIDNVLEHHFAAFQEEITELYNQNNKSIF